MVKKDLKCCPVGDGPWWTGVWSSFGRGKSRYSRQNVSVFVMRSLEVMSKWGHLRFNQKVTAYITRWFSIIPHYSSYFLISHNSETFYEFLFFHPFFECNETLSSRFSEFFESYNFRPQSSIRKLINLKLIRIHFWHIFLTFSDIFSIYFSHDFLFSPRICPESNCLTLEREQCSRFLFTPFWKLFETNSMGLRPIENRNFGGV